MADLPLIHLYGPRELSSNVEWVGRGIKKSKQVQAWAYKRWPIDPPTINMNIFLYSQIIEYSQYILNYYWEGGFDQLKIFQ